MIHQGWSLGGQLGIDIGRVLALDKKSKLRVIGVVMVDTLYPYWGPPNTLHAEFPAELVLGHCPPDMRQEILRCMQWSMMDSPEWVSKNWRAEGSNDQLQGIEAEEPPPAVLLYATKYIPVKGSDQGARAMTDYMRHARGGWNLFPHPNFIVAVWDLPTHHFALFEKHVVSSLLNPLRFSRHRLYSGITWMSGQIWLTFFCTITRASLLQQIKETSEKVMKACDLLAED